MGDYSPLIRKGGGTVAFILLAHATLFGQIDSPKVEYSPSLNRLSVIQLELASEKPSGPTALRVDFAGDIYLFNYLSGKLWHFDSTGKMQRTIYMGSYFSPFETGFTLELRPHADM